MEDDEMEIEGAYVVHEVDLDYEYDAPRFFDFVHEETPAEAARVERWFQSARSYPHSPFAEKLIMRDGMLSGNCEKVYMHWGDEGKAAMFAKNESGNGWSMLQSVRAISVDEGKECRMADGGIFGIMQCQDSRFHDQPAKAKTALKNPVKSRSSTLMKFTASAMAKQNQFNKSGINTMGQRNQQITSTSGLESQAAKRQKLERGHLFKVVEEKHSVSLIHKAPRKDGVSEKTPHRKLRITIPREPELETAQRAQRMRLKSTSEMEESLVNVRRFKARPLNRKILEAPQLPLSQRSTLRMPEFQLFHLKTSERAKRHTFSSSSAATYCNESDKELCKNDMFFGGGNKSKVMGRLPSLDSSRPEGSQLFNFRADPINRKILSSKGDMGVFSDTKHGTTLPNVDFNFQSGKRTVHDLSAELLSKLNLKSEYLLSNQPTKSSRPPCLPMKGSKENRFSSVPYKHEVAHAVNEKPPPYMLKEQFNNGSNEAMERGTNCIA